MILSYHAEWSRDHWCERDVDPEVCKIMQQVAAFDYARIAAEKADQGVPGGVSPESLASFCRPFHCVPSAQAASCTLKRIGPECP